MLYFKLLSYSSNIDCARDCIAVWVYVNGGFMGTDNGTEES
jgi:hypothetical protein